VGGCVGVDAGEGEGVLQSGERLTTASVTQDAVHHQELAAVELGGGETTGDDDETEAAHRRIARRAEDAGGHEMKRFPGGGEVRR
jgi:hypothetical protein